MWGTGGWGEIGLFSDFRQWSGCRWWWGEKILWGKCRDVGVCFRRRWWCGVREDWGKSVFLAIFANGVGVAGGWGRRFCGESVGVLVCVFGVVAGISLDQFTSDVCWVYKNTLFQSVLYLVCTKIDFYCK